MKKIAAMMVLGLLPLAGCANPQGYSNGPYAAYDSDYDQGYDGYDQPAPYGAGGYGPGYASGPYGGAYGPGYPPPVNQGYYGRGTYGQSYYGQSYYGQSTYDRPYGPTYRSSGYASSYYSPPPPPAYGPQPSPYYSTYYGCSCRR
jgi:hypothetical protein